MALTHVSPPAGSSVGGLAPLLTIRPSRGWVAPELLDLWRFRDLLLTLAARDLKLRYKQTALGAIWVVLQPLMAAGVFSFVFGTVARMPSDGVPYFIFSYAGLLGWNLFSGVLTKISGSLVGNSHLISKVFFPRLILPLSAVPSTLVDFAVAAGMMGVLMGTSGVWPSWALVWLPIWIALLLVLAAGIGLCAASLMVSYRDVAYILPVLVQILLYASPIAYAASAVPDKVRFWFDMNPLVPVLEAFRWSLLGTGEANWMRLTYAGTAAVIVLLVGVFSFKRMEKRFADVI